MNSFCYNHSVVRKISKIYPLLKISKNQSLKLNAISNLIGSGWMALVSILFVPVNLYYLGVEAYGIIGLFNSLQAITYLFDFGLSIIISRELARLSAAPENAQEMRDITRTSELINWTLGLLITLLLVALSPIIAAYWLQSERLPVTTVSQALMLMSIGFAAQWTTNFYINGLIGLQRQYLQNIINVVYTTFRAVGGVLVLILISPTIQAFLIWQVILSTLQALTMALALHKCLPETQSWGQFRWQLLKEKWRLAAGITGMSVLGLILHQLDKIILSKLLTLEFFGYYILATTIASMSLGMIAKGIAGAAYPRFSYLVSLNEQLQLSDLYHKSTQMISALMLPIAALLIVFPFEIIKLWTQNTTNATNTWKLLMVLAFGFSINGFLHIPYYIQLAHGWTKIIITSALIAVCIITPTMIFTVNRYGAIAGAVCWLCLNLFHLIMDVQMLHRYTLKGEQWKWYFVDIGKPFVVALTTALVGRFFLETDASQFNILILLISVGLTTYFLTALSIKYSRNLVRLLFRKGVRLVMQN